MYLHIVVERGDGWAWKPSFHKSSISTRVMWGYFAVAKIHVDEYEYATTEYDWIWPSNCKIPPRYKDNKFRTVKPHRGVTRA